MNNPILQKQIEEVFEELLLANETYPIIVEGKNDEVTLRKLGASGEIIRLNIGLSILNFCEEIARNYDEVILLPDWDNKGQQIFAKLKQDFKYNNVKTIKKFWRDLKRFCSKEVQEVEFLTKFLSN